MGWRLLALVGGGMMALLASGCSSDPERGYTAPEPQGEGGESATHGNGGAPGSGGAGGRAPDGTGAAAGAAGSGAEGPGPCSEIATFADGLSPTRELFVSASGDDDNDGSEAAPFATVERAAEDASAGTAIRILPGELPGGITVSDLEGRANAPVWIGGVPGRSRPTIRGGDTGLHLIRVRYVVVSNLDVVGSGDNGINCDDGGEYDDPDATRYVVFRSLGIRDIGGSGNQDCLKLSGVDDFWVLDSNFARCGGGESGSGIDHVGCHSGLVARNTFLTMSGSAVQCKGGSEDIEVRANLMRDGAARAVNMGGSTDFEFFRPPLSTTEENAEAQDIRVIANVMENATAPVAFVGCVDCLAANNTFVDPENWLLRILQETTTDDTYTFAEVRDGRFVNNLVYYDLSRLSTTINVGPNTQGDTFSFANNLWYAHDDPDNSLPADLPAEETDGISGEDPELGGGAYSISESSPAAGAGTDLEELTGDQAGNCFASPPSIGAFEVD